MRMTHMHYTTLAHSYTPTLCWAKKNWKEEKKPSSRPQKKTKLSHPKNSGAGLSGPTAARHARPQAGWLSFPIWKNTLASFGSSHLLDQGTLGTKAQLLLSSMEELSCHDTTRSSGQEGGKGGEDVFVVRFFSGETPYVF
jgi:hypothetical protein